MLEMPFRKLLGLKKSKKAEQNHAASQNQGPQLPLVQPYYSQPANLNNPHAQHQYNAQHNPHQYPTHQQSLSDAPLQGQHQGSQHVQQAPVRFPGPGLCLVCYNLHFAAVIRPGGAAHHASLRTLRAAIDGGCSLCKIFYHGLLRDDYNEVRLTNGTFNDNNPGFHFRIFKYGNADRLGIRGGPFSPQQLQDADALQNWLEESVKYNEGPSWISAGDFKVKLWEDSGMFHVLILVFRARAL
jgi:hypothetical protein